MCSGNVQKHSNPVFIHPDTVLVNDAVEGKNGPVKNNVDETTVDGDKESLKEEFGVDL